MLRNTNSKLRARAVGDNASEAAALGGTYALHWEFYGVLLAECRNLWMTIPLADWKILHHQAVKRDWVLSARDEEDTVNSGIPSR